MGYINFTNWNRIPNGVIHQIIVEKNIQSYFDYAILRILQKF